MISTLLLLIHLLGSSLSAINALHTTPVRKPKLADGCRDVYIDLGTNIGVQIRKVFEPHLYAGAAILPRFDTYLGTHRKDTVCVFGFEPNPTHKSVLKELQDTYRALGYRVFILPCAVSNIHGIMPFARQPSRAKDKELGARLGTEGEPGYDKVIVNVTVIDFAEFFSQEIKGRLIPDDGLHHTRKPTVIAKTDVEGHEGVVWGHMLATGLICDIDYVYYEHSMNWLVTALKPIAQRAACPIKFERMDDESFNTDKIELPALPTGANHNTHWRKSKLADGCRNVFVDVGGSNAGSEARKAMHSSIAAESQEQTLLTTFFGSDRKQLCAFIVEPGKANAPQLAELERVYRSKGHNLTVVWHETDVFSLRQFMLTEVVGRIIPITDHEEHLPPAVVLHRDSAESATRLDALRSVTCYVTAVYGRASWDLIEYSLDPHVPTCDLSYSRITSSPILTPLPSLATIERAVNVADGCRHIFIDLHAGSGEAIKAVFESGAKPGLAVFYNQMFGETRGDVCAFGFETLAEQMEPLQRLKSELTSRGHRLQVSTALTADAFVEFFATTIVGRVVDEASQQSRIVIRSRYAEDKAIWARLVISGHFCQINVIVGAQKSLWWLDGIINNMAVNEHGRCNINAVRE